MKSFDEKWFAMYGHGRNLVSHATTAKAAWEEANRRRSGLTEEQRKSFEEVARPLIKWLNDNCHPHVTVVVDCSHAELSKGVNSFRTEDYWKD